MPIPQRHLPVPSPAQPVGIGQVGFSPPSQFGLVREGTPWSPPDPDAFDRLLPKSTSRLLPEQPGPWAAKQAYRRVFEMLVDAEERKAKLLEAIEEVFRRRTAGSRKDKANAMLNLMNVVTQERKEMERREREGILKPFVPPGE